MKHSLQKFLPPVLLVSALANIIVGLLIPIYSNQVNKIDTNNGFLGSHNWSAWINGCFSLRPDTFFFYWLPLLFGLWGLYSFCVSEKRSGSTLKRNPIRLMIFCLFSALFLNLPYLNAVGIVCCIMNLVAMLLVLIVTAIHLVSTRKASSNV